jgi:predicted O-methyltransferase YrrM
MEHFYQQIRDESYFSFPDIYRRMVERFPSGSVFVELGVLHGKSLAYLGVEVVNSGKSIQLYGVDNFRWSWQQMSKVRKNLEPLEGRLPIELMCGDSADAAQQFSSMSVDFVFIDTDHSYEGAWRDIQAWLPKMRRGGVIAGHDYDRNSFPGVCRAVDEIFANNTLLKFSDWTVWEVER